MSLKVADQDSFEKMSLLGSSREPSLDVTPNFIKRRPPSLDLSTSRSLREKSVVLDIDSPKVRLQGVGLDFTLEVSTPTSAQQKPKLSLLERRKLQLNAKELGGSSTPASRHRLSVLSLGSSGPTKEEVQAEVERLEIAEAHRYIARFDCSAPGRSIRNVLQAKYPGKLIELVNIAEGVTDTKIVKVNGVARHILKKVSLPENVFTNHWRDVEQRLTLIGGDDVREQVSNLFLDSPGQILAQQYPHLNGAQREKLAYTFGEDLGIPHTDVIEAQDGIFSLHEFVENQGSSRTFDLASRENQALINVQNLQNIGILDILLENQDRNPGNILVVPEVVSPWWSCGLPCFSSTQLNLVPIDHALTYQQLNFKEALVFGQGVKAPCWTNWEKSDEALTDETKTAIASLDAATMLRKAEAQGLVIDQKVRESLPRNIAFLQEAVQRNNGNITLNELYRAFTSLD